MQDQTKSKIFYYNDGKKRFNWRDIAAILPIIAFVIIGIDWFGDRRVEQDHTMQYGEDLIKMDERLKAVEREQERSRQHDLDMIEMKKQQEEMKRWQIEWPTEGELSLDGVQNNRLDEHDRRLGVLEK